MIGKLSNCPVCRNIKCNCPQTIAIKHDKIYNYDTFPYSISEWINLGVERRYYEFIEKRIIDEYKEKIIKKLVDFFKEEDGYTGAYVEKIKPAHGPCCCCMDCGQYDDDCVCTNNRIHNFIKELLNL